MGSSVKYTPAQRFTRGSSTATKSGCGCADCGGLECLCRPRFFAGQLLTEEEFNRLDRYIVGKHKLHNRYLHGWGVVCGLDVVCDGCNGGVVVKEGYALSPCGEDIVVCNDTPVDICSLINACKKKEQPDCGAPTNTTGCDDVEQQWVLAVCYSESASRGITPLRNGGTSSGSCGCGGTSGGSKSPHTTTSGCGCGGTSHSAQRNVSSASRGCGCGGGASQGRSSAGFQSCAAPAQCEPTVVCEGYSFRVYPAPRATQKEQKTSGAMVDRFMACYNDFLEAMPQIPSEYTQQTLHDWCCDAKEALLDYLASHSEYDCGLRRSVSLVVCPSTNLESEAFSAAFSTAREQLVTVAGEIMFACICRALQPPCPEPAVDNCVPLAVVTVNRSNGCKVESVCNWTTLRKYVMMFPNLQYWLSILPFGRMIRESLERFCCSGGGLRQYMHDIPKQKIDPTTGQSTNANTVDAEASGFWTKSSATRAETADRAERIEMEGMAHESVYRKSLDDIFPADMFRPSVQTINHTRALSELVKEAFSSRNRPASAQTLLSGMLGAKGSNGEEYLSQTQRDNLAQFFVLDQMAKPMLRTMMASIGSEDTQEKTQVVDLSALMSLFDGGGSTSTAAAESDLRAQLDELRTVVQRQQATIDGLTQAAKQTNEQTAKQSAKQAVKQTVKQATKQPAKQSVKQSAGLSVKEAAKPSATKGGQKRPIKRRPGPSNS